MNPKKNMMRILQDHNRSFINWFKETIFADDGASTTLRLLVVGPKMTKAQFKIVV